MLCYVDESWQDAAEKIGVLGAVIAPVGRFDHLDKRLFAIRKKYYGQEQAKSRKSELKGKDLFSGASFRSMRRYGFSRNLTVAREVLISAEELGIKVIGVTVYGTKRPPLLSPDHRKLERPFLELCQRALSTIPSGRYATLVFDQRFSQQQSDISIGVHNYLAGLPRGCRLRPYPFVGVSNVHAGLQLADIVAYVLGRWAAGDDRFRSWYQRVGRLQVDRPKSKGGGTFGLVRLQWTGDRYLVRRERTKKIEPGPSEEEGN